ncbi:MAG: cytochrome b N-terminal domain-containing protein [Candidatus Geothermarchaeales archaeon]
MGEQSEETLWGRVLERVDTIYDWVVGRLERTWFLALRFSLPTRHPNPLTFLGMLTFVMFLILGITGALLMWYYDPAFGESNSAWESVATIQEEVPFGYVMRQVHYHASNAMIFLAAAHLFYQYFKGRYKLKYEMLWVTGVIFGVLTVFAAYTGYNLLFNDRGVLAINIGSQLAAISTCPFYCEFGQLLDSIIFGGGFDQLVRTMYTLHVFIIPALMFLIGIFHLPKNLVLDIPTVSGVLGAVFLVGGLFPIELGTKFIIGRVSVTVPEWYFSSLYSFLRADFIREATPFGFSAFIFGGIIPTLFVLMWLVIPFIGSLLPSLDPPRKLKVRDRPFLGALGLAAILQIIVATTWGFFACLIDPSTGASECSTKGGYIPLFYFDFVTQYENFPQFLAGNLYGLTFWGLMVGVTLVAYAFVYLWYAKRQPPKRRGGRRERTFLDSRWITLVTIALIAFQVFMNLSAFLAFLEGMRNLVMIQLGIILVVFGITFHLYRSIRALTFP